MELLIHPTQCADMVRRFTVTAVCEADGSLRLRYGLAADMEQLRLPVSVSLQRTDGLWRHTCFELFIAGQGVSAYHEFNFSPSGEWAAYAFSANRTGMKVLALPVVLPARWQRSPEGLALEVLLPAQCLPVAAAGTLRLGLCAVLEAQSGTITHWALRHVGNLPDFHHPDSFILELAADPHS